MYGKRSFSLQELDPGLTKTSSNELCLRKYYKHDRTRRRCVGIATGINKGPCIFPSSTEENKGIQKKRCKILIDDEEEELGGSGDDTDKPLKKEAQKDGPHNKLKPLIFSNSMK